MYAPAWRKGYVGMLVGLLFLCGGGGARGQATDGTGKAAYDSRYLVFGTQDATGTPRIVAIDLNRTTQKDGRVTYEYKVFAAVGGDWRLPVYEQWTVDPDTTDLFPARKGVHPRVDGNQRLRVTVEAVDLALEVTMEPPTFAFSSTESRFGTIRTAHPRLTVTWNGTAYDGPGVYEWVQSKAEASSPPEGARAELERRLDENATFGVYDWMVLYDDTGRLWHVSQGTLTPDFGYQQGAPDRPAATDDVFVRWLATRRDTTAGMHRPTRWLVDVPPWEMRVRLQQVGEHRGHGPMQPDGTRPIYVQATVTGTGRILGKEQEVFGMVELIRD